MELFKFTIVNNWEGCSYGALADRFVGRTVIISVTGNAVVTAIKGTTNESLPTSGTKTKARIIAAKPT